VVHLNDGPGRRANPELEENDLAKAFRAPAIGREFKVANRVALAWRLMASSTGNSRRDESRPYESPTAMPDVDGSMPKPGWEEHDVGA
jgi:hypothetical protein